MRTTLVIAVTGALVLAGAAAGQTPPATPTPETGLLVDVSVLPVSEVPMVMVPGDRTDKAAYVAQIMVVGPTDKPVTYAHKQLVVFAGEEAKGSFRGGGLSVAYRIKLQPEERTADASVRVTRDGRFVGGSRTQIRIAVPKAGLTPAPGK